MSDAELRELLDDVPAHLRPTVELLLTAPESQRLRLVEQLDRPGTPPSLKRVVERVRRVA
jgi:hypothetical protein